jgi:hypothetical protein
MPTLRCRRRHDRDLCRDLVFFAVLSRNLDLKLALQVG